MDMQELVIEPVPMDRFGDLLPTERILRLSAAAEEVRDLTRGRVVWNVSATAHGGGVAEMLQTLLAFVRGVHVDTRWFVLTGGRDFFTVTKRVHNMLHGEPGDGGRLTAADVAVLRAGLAPDVEQMSSLVSAGDVVVLHDPQTAGLVRPMQACGAVVVWRCHVGRDSSNALTDEAWSFLRPLVETADAFVFSRDAYAPGWCRRGRLHVITPSIDPFSAKNCPLDEVEVRSSLSRAGLVEGEVDLDALGFSRREGGAGVVRRHAGLLVDGPPVPEHARLVLQVSRWDRLKDMSGVMSSLSASLPQDAHLLLVGPDVTGVSDDPEGAAVLSGCRTQWAGLPAAQQERVHLVCLPMDDVDENAHLVNALQRRADVVVQKSLQEGFGLTVTEAMWKARPVVASAVGGICDQVDDGRDGLLLRDATDLEGLAILVRRVLGDRALAARLGRAARETVLDRFLGDRHLEAYVDLLRALLGPPSAA
ncbi:MAG: glycosyl transferase family 1 [Marmoricola sp.]|nr:glycosyl transferase family 1 [Marmoricola sp.]